MVTIRVPELLFSDLFSININNLFKAVEWFKNGVPPSHHTIFFVDKVNIHVFNFFVELNIFGTRLSICN